MRRRAALIGATLLFASRGAMAQSNDRSAPIGGRSQLLGGTGMTYGRDATAAFVGNGNLGMLLKGHGKEAVEAHFAAHRQQF